MHDSVLAAGRCSSVITIEDSVTRAPPRYDVRGFKNQFILLSELLHFIIIATIWFKFQTKPTDSKVSEKLIK